MVKPLGRIRHDDAMAPSVHAVKAPPQAVLDAHEAVKAPVRIVIAHYLADHPGARMGDLIEGIGGERHNLQVHLAAMHRVGVVLFDTPGGPSSSSRLREYRLDHTRWAQLMIRLINYIPSERY